MTIHHLRRDYRFGSLTRDQMPEDPIALFRTWFDELRSMDLPEWFEPNAMSLATAKPERGAACRIVLLKEFDDRGFTFFTNYLSSKGEQIAADNRVALGFFWPILERQIRIEGFATKVDPSLSEKYFRSRPRSSQLSANASPQSQIIQDESTLTQLVEDLDAKLQGAEVPCPEHWGGYRVSPELIEFWQGRPSRLHDRFRYLRRPGGWQVDRLGP
ncbi:MAG: pyridoxamine 5'-phosphate oxidase [Planctomycetota bacterium]